MSTAFGTTGKSQISGATPQKTSSVAKELPEQGDELLRVGESGLLLSSSEDESLEGDVTSASGKRSKEGSEDAVRCSRVRR